MVVPHRSDDKAISAQLSWRLTGWHVLSLAKSMRVQATLKDFELSNEN